MRFILTTISLLFFTLTLSAQSTPDLNKIAANIVDEAKELYNLERASWLGTDLFMEKSSDKANIGGYISYKDANATKCIFFSQDDQPDVLGTITFDNTFDLNKASVDLNKREMTEPEKDLCVFRQKALEEINSDTLFKSYSNTSLNIIPIIYKGDKKVYVLTGPKQAGVMLFGNDYLLTFDKSNNILSKEALHKSLIPIFFEEESGKQSISAMHSHLADKDPFITVTDVCTLMLYQQFSPWETHYVISPKYVSIWNCKSNQLNIVTKEAFDKLKK